MTWMAMLLGLFLPACGAPGAQGLPTPPPGTLATLRRPASPNSALAAPAGFTPGADIVLPVYHLPPAQLFAAIEAVAAGEPRVFVQIVYPATLEAHWVARSAVLNFPDLIVAQVSPAGKDSSTLTLYSHSVYGYSDLGVNRKRLDAWIAALNARLPAANSRS